MWRSSDPSHDSHWFTILHHISPVHYVVCIQRISWWYSSIDFIFHIMIIHGMFQDSIMIFPHIHHRYSPVHYSEYIATTYNLQLIVINLYSPIIYGNAINFMIFTRVTWHHEYYQHAMVNHHSTPGLFWEQWQISLRRHRRGLSSTLNRMLSSTAY